jgi:hypothetical protein
MCGWQVLMCLVLLAIFGRWAAAGGVCDAVEVGGRVNLQVQWLGEVHGLVLTAEHSPARHEGLCLIFLPSSMSHYTSGYSLYGA